MRRQAEFDQHEREVESREGLSSDLLTDPKRIDGDLKLVKKSLRWGLGGAKKRRIVERLFAIANKEATVRISKDGQEVNDAELADKNALAASALLIAIESQQQKDDHLERRMQKPSNPQKPQTTINLGVNVDNRIDERRSRTLAIAHRFGTGRVLLEGSAGDG